MNASVFNYKNKVIFILFTISLIAFIPMFIGVNVFIKAASDELIISWYENEKVSIQQGNIFSSVSKLQRSIISSALLKSVVVQDKADRVLVSFGVPEVRYSNQKLIHLHSYKNISFFKKNFYETVYVFSNEDLKVLILTGSLLSIYLLAGILIYLIVLLSLFGYLVMRETKSEENFKSEIEINRIKFNLEMSEKINTIASQVSHDIRSPLEALNMTLVEISSLTLDQKMLLENSTQRINDIANDLLLSTKKESKNAKDLTEESLNPLILSIVAEKKMQFKDLTNVELNLSLFTSSNVKVKINKIEMQRTLSNILNNSFEAISSSGKIVVSVSEINQNVSIVISDNGVGIPKDVITRLGEKGFTYGEKINFKKSGAGLGIFHAKNTIEAFNGELQVQSQLNEGTSIIITLPKINYKMNSLLDDPIPLSKNVSYYEYVYIDDEELLLLSWNLKAKKNNINCLVLKTTDDFNRNIQFISKDKTKIYIDYDLGIDQIKGEEFALSLHEQGFKNLYIASGYDAKRFAHLKWLNYSGKKCPF